MPDFNGVYSAHIDLLFSLVAYEQAVKQQQMRAEMSQAKRENRHYLASVDKGKEVGAIVERKRRQGASEEEVSVICSCIERRVCTAGTSTLYFYEPLIVRSLPKIQE